MANPWVDLGAQPLVRQPLSNEKREALRHELAYLASKSGVRDAAGWQNFLPQYLQLTQAMSDVINPQASNGFTQALVAATHTASQGAIGTNAALQSIQSILLNRRDDLVASQSVLMEPQFTDSAYRLLEKNRFEMSGDLGPLPPVKQQELMETLLQPRAGRMEPAAHIHATALGHAVTHAALANAFMPSGGAASVLADQLQQKTSTIDPALTNAYAARWLEIRHTRAQQVATAYESGSRLVQSAVRLSEENRLSRAAQPMSMVMNSASAPSARSFATGTDRAPRTVITVMDHVREFFRPLMDLGTTRS